METVQVGIKALRDPVTREFLEAKPILFPATPELLERERLMIADLEQIKAKAVKSYIDALQEVKKQEKEFKKRSKSL